MYDNKGKICDYVTLTNKEVTTKIITVDGSNFSVPSASNGVYEFTVPLSVYQNLQRSQAVSVSLVSGHLNTLTKVSNSTLITYESGCMNSYKNVLGFGRPQIYVTGTYNAETIQTELHYIDNAQPIEVFTQPRPTTIRIGVYNEVGGVINNISIFGLLLKFTYYNEQETAQNLHNQNTALLK